jgi:excisionase family DNA binding protein
MRYSIPLEERYGVTVQTAAEFTGLSKSTVYELLRDGRLEGKVMGGRRIVLVHSLLRMCAEAPSTERERNDPPPV